MTNKTKCKFKHQLLPYNVIFVKIHDKILSYCESIKWNVYTAELRILNFTCKHACVFVCLCIAAALSTNGWYAFTHKFILWIHQMKIFVYSHKNSVVWLSLINPNTNIKIVEKICDRQPKRDKHAKGSGFISNSRTRNSRKSLDEYGHRMMRMDWTK